MEVGVLADLRLDVRDLSVAQKRQRIIGALCPDEGGAVARGEAEAEERRLAAGAAERDAVDRLPWLEQQLQARDQAQLRALPALRGVRQHDLTVENLRQRLVEHFAKEVRSEWVRVASRLDSSSLHAARFQLLRFILPLPWYTYRWLRHGIWELRK